MLEIPSADLEQQWFETFLIDPPRGENGGDRRRGNRVSFGLPMTRSLELLLSDAGIKPPFEIRLQQERYDFWLIRLVCSLHPAQGSTMRWLEVKVELSDVPAGELTMIDTADPPLVFDLSPENVSTPVTVERRASISPEIEFKSVSAAVGEVGLILKYQQLKPQIIAFGKRESAAYWRYTPGTEGNVPEGIKEMDLIVRRRKNTQTRVTVTVDGRSQGWGIFPAPLQLDDQRFTF